MFKAMTAHRSF